MKPEGYRHLNWGEGLRALRVVLPAAQVFSPDELPPFPPDSWSPLALSGRSDAEIAGDLWALVPKPGSGLLVVVTFASFERLGPFFVQAESLDALIVAHPDATGDTFFSGDVVILNESENAVIVVHHEEIVGFWKGLRPTQTPQRAARDPFGNVGSRASRSRAFG